MREGKCFVLHFIIERIAHFPRRERERERERRMLPNASHQTYIIEFQLFSVHIWNSAREAERKESNR